MAIKDYTGMQFSYLTVIGNMPSRNKHRFVLAKCECGREKEMRLSHIAYGKTKSCGCKMAYIRIESTKTHGESGSVEHNTWARMVGRCYNNRNATYHTHGARGIKVCESWRHSFECFLSDMGRKPLGTSLDRVDNNGNYEPSNCRWATPKQQSRNTRRTIMVIFGGEVKPLIEVCEQLKVDVNLVRQRIRRSGWDVYKALGMRPAPVIVVNWSKAQGE